MKTPKNIFIVRERETDIIIDTYTCVGVYYYGNQAYKDLIEVRWDIAKIIKEAYTEAEFKKLKLPEHFDKKEYYTKSVKGYLEGATQYDKYHTTFDYNKVFFKYDDAKKHLIKKQLDRMFYHRDKIAWHNQQLIMARSQYRAIAPKSHFNLYGKKFRG